MDKTYFGMTFQKRGGSAVLAIASSETPLPPPEVGQSINVSIGSGKQLLGKVEEVEYQLNISTIAGSANRTLTYNVMLA